MLGALGPVRTRQAERHRRAWFPDVFETFAASRSSDTSRERISVPELCETPDRSRRCGSRAGTAAVQKRERRKAAQGAEGFAAMADRRLSVAGFGERLAERRVEENRVVAEAAVAPRFRRDRGLRRSRAFRTGRDRPSRAPARRRTRAGAGLPAAPWRAARRRSARTSPGTTCPRRRSAPTRRPARRRARQSPAPNPPRPSARRSPPRSTAPWRARCPQRSAPFRPAPRRCGHAARVTSRTAARRGADGFPELCRDWSSRSEQAQSAITDQRSEWLTAEPDDLRQDCD